MDKYIYDESNGLWYELRGDYYFPCLILSAEEEQPIGLWDQKHKCFLMEHQKETYHDLLSTGKLNSYLAEIDHQAQERLEGLIEQMKEMQGVTISSKLKHP